MQYKIIKIFHQFMSCRWHTQIGRFYLFIFRWFNFDDASSFKMLLPTESITISSWTIRAYRYVTTLLAIPSSIAFFMIFPIVAPPTSSPCMSWIRILRVNTHCMTWNNIRWWQSWKCAVYHSSICATNYCPWMLRWLTILSPSQKQINIFGTNIGKCIRQHILG